MIEVNNLTKTTIDKKFLDRVAKIVLKGENIRNKDISIVLVGQAEIRRLNKKYRKIDKPTDILSFEGELNEIVICPEVIKKNAKKFKSNFKKELTLVLIHGVLHLLGYDHEVSEKMREKEKFYLSKIIKK